MKRLFLLIALLASAAQAQFVVTAPTQAACVAAASSAGGTCLVPYVAPVVTPPVVVPPVVLPPVVTVTALPGLGGVADGNCQTVTTAPGSGLPINLNTITATQGKVAGGQRCETFYQNMGHDLPDGVPQCGAFAGGMKTSMPSTSGDSSMVVMQTHTQASGDTNPPFALLANGQGSGALWYNVSYQNNPYSGPKRDSLAAASNKTVFTEPLPPAGQIYKWVWYVVLQWDVNAKPSPVVTWWRAKPGQAFEKLFTYTGPNDYNVSQNIWQGDAYPRIGLYKWSDWVSGQQPIQWWLTDLKFASKPDAASCLAAGAAALQGY